MSVPGVSSGRMYPSVKKCLLFASVCCISGIHSYNIQRIDNENVQPVNLEIDFFSNYETRKFLDDFEKASSEEMYFKSKQYESTKAPDENQSTPLESWSVVWYIASFGGLIIFFLIVSCSEWCCRRAIRNGQNCTSRNTQPPSSPAVPDSPPPSYDQFAPPSYESICLGRHERGSEKSEYDIFVVPVHALGPMGTMATIMENREAEDAPPSYLSASFVPALTGLESSQQSRVT